MNSNLPYSEIFFPLLKSIHKALYQCHILNKNNSQSGDSNFNNKYEFFYISPENIEIKKCFAEFENFYKAGINKHITVGNSKTDQNRRGISPRLARITIQAYKQAQQIKQNQNFKGLVIPSPFHILFQALTVPGEQQTSAFSHVICRSMLFYFMQLHPEGNEPSINRDHFSYFTENDIIDSLSSFKKYVKIQLRWPDQRNNKNSEGFSMRVNFLLGQYLSMKGYSHLWFNNEKTLNTFLVEDPKKKYINSLITKYQNPDYRFRISDSYTDFPEDGEIINSLFGIPLPIRGGDVLFYGGIKKSASGGAVINLSGKPGVGKTSVALSLSSLFSPFGTKTIYLSLEEDPEDLYKRLLTLIPEYLKELSFYLKPNGINDTPWFEVFKIEDTMDFEKLTELISLIKSGIDDEQLEQSENEISIPSVCPLYIVIDNLNEIAIDNNPSYKKIETFIKTCRNLGALVLLISSEEVSDKINLGYLVDISIHAKQLGTDNNLIKPTRIFQLNKTRNQISRQGSHIFHLTGSEGFRISPQVPSLTDKKENLKRLLPDKRKYITTLNLLEQEKKKPEYTPYLKMFQNSQILIQGQGSSGKAGLGLKILFTPIIEKKKDHKYITDFEENVFLESQIFEADFSHGEHLKKVLIISFLYPKEYYEELIEEKIIPSLRKINKSIKYFKYKSLPFFPGYLTAEDFVNKVVRSLDEAILEGEAYTGVILDGLHNILLQFKNLQENDMVWPLLYGILSRYNVTVVSTFTNFSINSQNDDSYLTTMLIEDQKLMQKGLTPLLHSMVKACDFYISLEEKQQLDNERFYQIAVFSSIDQVPPKSKLDWDRQKLTITKYV